MKYLAVTKNDQIWYGTSIFVSNAVFGKSKKKYKFMNNLRFQKHFRGHTHT